MTIFLISYKGITNIRISVMLEWKCERKFPAIQFQELKHQVGISCLYPHAERSIMWWIDDILKLDWDKCSLSSLWAISSSNLIFTLQDWKDSKIWSEGTKIVSNGLGGWWGYILSWKVSPWAQGTPFDSYIDSPPVRRNKVWENEISETPSSLRCQVTFRYRKKKKNP